MCDAFAVRFRSKCPPLYRWCNVCGVACTPARRPTWQWPDKIQLGVKRLSAEVAVRQTRMMNASPKWKRKYSAGDYAGECWLICVLKSEDDDDGQIVEDWTSGRADAPVLLMILLITYIQQHSPPAQKLTSGNATIGTDLAWRLCTVISTTVSRRTINAHTKSLQVFYIIQDSLDKLMHFLPQPSDFVPLRNGFHSFHAQTA